MFKSLGFSTLRERGGGAITLYFHVVFQAFAKLLFFSRGAEQKGVEEGSKRGVHLLYQPDAKYRLLMLTPLVQVL